MSKSELSRLSGISSPTVIKIVDFLRDRGLVEETSGKNPGVGRKPQLVRLNPNAIYAVGVIIEGEYIRVGIVNIAGDIYPSNLRKAGANLAESLSVILPEMIESVVDAIVPNRIGIRGIGLGVPGGYNPKTHVVNFAPLIHLNEPTSIAHHEQLLKDRFSLPVFVDNDVNMAALGEYRMRKLNHSDLIYISFGTGIGAGIILDGHLRTGNTWQCGEIGYMTFIGNYTPGYQRPGWLENEINLTALREKFNFDPYKPNGQSLPAVIDYVSNSLAICISNVVSLLDCDRVVLGGVIAQSLGMPLIECVNSKVQGLCVLPTNVERQTSLDPGVVGAASVVIDHAIKATLSDKNQ